MNESTDAWPSLNEPTLAPEPDTAAAPPPPPPPPGYAGPPAPPPPDRRLGAGMLLGILAVLLAAAAVLLAWYLSNRGSSTQVTTVVTTTERVRTGAAAGAAKVIVPQLVGMTEHQALARLAADGLGSKVLARRSSEPAGRVLAQEPAEATQAPKGTTIRITVARPSASASASAPASTTAPAATTTTPAATTTETTSPTATTAAPPAPTTAQVPDLSGQTEAAAAQALTQVGIRPSFVFVPSSLPLGSVVGQAKRAGATVPARSHVQVNLAQGPHMQTTVETPSVVGSTLTGAVSTLNGAGLRLIYAKAPVASRAQAGKITAQTPGAGAQIPKNAQVLVFLAVYRTG